MDIGKRLEKGVGHQKTLLFVFCFLMDGMKNDDYEVGQKKKRRGQRMHPSLENINLFDIGSLKEETVKDILTEARVLADRISTPICPICGHETSANKDSSRKLGWVWICKNKYRFGCSGKINPLSNTFFENIKIRLLDVFLLIICFVTKMQVSLVLEHLNLFRNRRGQPQMSWATIVDFYSLMREVTEIVASHHDKLLGGPENENKHFKKAIVSRQSEKHLKQYMALHFYRRTRLSTMKSLDAKVQLFLEDISLVFPGYGKKALELKKIEIPTVESEGISDKMPKTSNKKLLEALSDDDDVPFMDDVDGDPDWEDF
ncbi:uncharacterized protein NPIL_201531 [Nephila pilipes]|uniref:Uncharacterized protein n=1 Tax=Nephila pilipes TaxID=299642 RepID=A0A8X6J5R4_NEPPI|nr:uncharacterized protein NPIL_201531 [Nephila pilipes]